MTTFHQFFCAVAFAILSICGFAVIGIQLIILEASGPASRWFDTATCNVTNITHTKIIRMRSKCYKCGGVPTTFDVYTYGFCANLNPPSPAECGLTSASEEHEEGTVPSGVPSYAVGEQTACWVPTVPFGSLPRVFRCGNPKCIKILNPDSDTSSSLNSLLGWAFGAGLSGLLALCCFRGTRKQDRRHVYERTHATIRSPFRRGEQEATAGLNRNNSPPPPARSAGDVPVVVGTVVVNPPVVLGTAL